MRQRQILEQAYSPVPLHACCVLPSGLLGVTGSEGMLLSIPFDALHGKSGFAILISYVNRQKYKSDQAAVLCGDSGPWQNRGQWQNRASVVVYVAGLPGCRITDPSAYVCLTSVLW